MGGGSGGVKLSSRAGGFGRKGGQLEVVFLCEVMGGGGRVEGVTKTIADDRIEWNRTEYRIE